MKYSALTQKKENRVYNTSYDQQKSNNREVLDGEPEAEK